MQEQYKGMGLGVILGIVGYLLALLVFDDIHARLIGAVVFLVTLWTNEALPLGVVSLIPIVLFPSLDILSTAQTTANYSKSIIFLFLGGFLLAIAVEKTGLHKIIAHKLLGIFPKSSRGIIFALAITSAVLSSLLSNTTTALLLMPIALFLTDHKELKIRFVLAVAYGASIGGIVTPIGTPPNLILMGFMQEHSFESIAFIVWIAKMLPLALIMLTVVPYFLSINTAQYYVQNSFHKNNTLSFNQTRLLKILGLLILVLFINSYFKVSEAGILLSFGLLMLFPKIGFLKWEDTQKIPYEIIFLFGAGFSIAAGFSDTGLAKEISQLLLGLTTMHFIFVLLIVATLVTFTTEVTSNTALISIALPILFALGSGSSLDTQTILMVATICASYAFMLPIATPPNAIAMSSKVVNIKTMAKYGLLFNFFGIGLTVMISQVWWSLF
jgi:sodium-dependent dicarboxylate transporter 2/3/5